MVVQPLGEIRPPKQSPIGAGASVVRDGDRTVAPGVPPCRASVSRARPSGCSPPRAKEQSRQPQRERPSATGWARSGHAPLADTTTELATDQWRAGDRKVTEASTGPARRQGDRSRLPADPRAAWFRATPRPRAPRRRLLFRPSSLLTRPTDDCSSRWCAARRELDAVGIEEPPEVVLADGATGTCPDRATRRRRQPSDRQSRHQCSLGSAGRRAPTTRQACPPPLCPHAARHHQRPPRRDLHPTTTDVRAGVAQTRVIRRADRFQRRGLAACPAEWHLLAATHNLRRPAPTLA